MSEHSVDDEEWFGLGEDMEEVGLSSDVVKEDTDVGKGFSFEQFRKESSPKKQSSSGGASEEVVSPVYTPMPSPEPEPASSPESSPAPPPPAAASPFTPPPPPPPPPMPTPQTSPPPSGVTFGSAPEPVPTVQPFPTTPAPDLPPPPTSRRSSGESYPEFLDDEISPSSLVDNKTVVGYGSGDTESYGEHIAGGVRKNNDLSSSSDEMFDTLYFSSPEDASDEVVEGDFRDDGGEIFYDETVNETDDSLESSSFSNVESKKRRKVFGKKKTKNGAEREVLKKKSSEEIWRKVFRFATWGAIFLVLAVGLKQIFAPEVVPVDDIATQVSQDLNVSGFPVDSGTLIGEEFLTAYFTIPNTSAEETVKVETLTQFLSPNVKVEEFAVTTPVLTEQEREANIVNGQFKNPYLQVVTRPPTLASPPIPINTDGRIRQSPCNVTVEGTCRALFTFYTQITNPNARVKDPEDGNVLIPKPPEDVYTTIPMIATYTTETGVSVAVDGPLGFTPPPAPVTEVDRIGLPNDPAAVEQITPQLVGFFEAWAASDLEKMNRYLLPDKGNPQLRRGLAGAYVLNDKVNNPPDPATGKVGGVSDPVRNVTVEALPEESLPSATRLGSATVSWLNPATRVSFTQTYTLALTQDGSGRWYVTGISGGEFR